VRRRELDDFCLPGDGDLVGLQEQGFGASLHDAREGGLQAATLA
jgi:hypothetical protein